MAYTNIDDPSAFFQTFLYTGNQSGRQITLDGNSDLQPDLYWYKARNSNHHYWVDSSRGTTKYIYSSLTSAEATVASAYVTSFNTNGFGVGGGDSGTNANGISFGNWAWKANGGTTVSNTDGSVTSTVQANQDAGFSIQTFTSASSGNSNWGHGLGVTPDVFIVKRRDGTSSWWGHWKGTSRTAGSGNNWQYMPLDSTAAATSLSTFKADSTTITTSNDFVPNSASMVCYAFAEKQGYSKFGKYVGNGEVNGAFVYTGFKPAFVILKGSSASGAWYMLDSKRDVDNVANHALEAQSNGAEYTNYNFIDMLSNGFKLRLGTSEVNTSGNTYIYMAFAENPFVTSTGIPTTAR